MSISASGMAVVSGWAVSADKIGLRLVGREPEYTGYGQGVNWDLEFQCNSGRSLEKARRDNRNTPPPPLVRAAGCVFNNVRQGFVVTVQPPRRPKNRLFGRFLYLTGGGLFSHLVARAVSSALRRFTSVFGMGTGGTTSL